MSEEKAPPKETKTDETEEFDWIRPVGGIPEVYGDYVYVNWTSIKIRIRLGHLLADPRVNPSQAKWIVEERAGITIPYFTAKVLRNLLDGLVKSYEKKNGEIKLPEIPEPEIPKG